MGDVHIPQPEPSAIGAKVDALIEAGHELYATALTGSPAGRVRRPTLFAIAVLGNVVSLVAGRDGLLAGAIALIAIVLLAMSDNEVEL